jgi:hypothetical protein
MHLALLTHIPLHAAVWPAEVQRRAAPVILSGADCVIASQTGSGAGTCHWGSLASSQGFICFRAQPGLCQGFSGLGRGLVRG